MRNEALEPLCGLCVFCEADRALKLSNLGDAKHRKRADFLAHRPMRPVG